MLALVVKEGLETQRTVIDLLAKCRSVVGHFHHSPTAVSKLHEIQRELRLPLHQLKQEVKTRWNATVDCLERLLEQKEAVTLYSIREKSIRSNIDWQLAEKVVFILAKFREASLNAQKDDACISVIIPLYTSLVNFLQSNFAEKEGLGSFCDCLLNGLMRRFAPVFGRKESLLATLLDPRFKSQCFSTHQLVLAKKLLVSELNLIEGTAPPSPKRIASTASLWNFLVPESAETHNDQQQTEETESIAMCTRADQEITVYLGTPCERFDTNIYEFWSKQLALKNLRKLALRFLSSPPTSAPSECLFSDAGRLYDERRSRLLPENAQKILFLMNNLKMQD